MLLHIGSSELIEELPRLIILDLTKYEIGNAVRYDRSVKDPIKLVGYWEELLSEIREETIDDMKSVQGIALEKNLTFYDAAYVHMAVRSESKLVTSDSGILQKCKNTVLDLDGFKKEILKR